jgi:lipopolysaccharide transport system ATP-binding protein
MSTVITVQNLGKKYTISHQQRDDSSSLRDVITNGARSLSKKIFSPFTPHSSPLSVSEDFWALQDVSFEVKQGDRIGIIGRNGAGKSTLLKILSRITEPTTGSIRIKGRVASLLEVGTGFHPELTGRENIFLNGAILGMQREEIRRKFDEIVDFAEIEKFLDTPVKRYSSGMYVRLAFAVAAHLEPEILIVDEVLAVGDAQFQKKCLGKMESVGREGRTIIFVSHNMEAIKSICSVGLLFKNGELLLQGNVGIVHKKYINMFYNGTSSSTWILNQENDEVTSILQQVSVLDATLNVCSSFKNTDEIIFEFSYKQAPSDIIYRLVFTVVDAYGKLIFTSSNHDLMGNIKPGNNIFIAKIGSPFLAMGKYHVNVRFDVPNVKIFEVVDRCVSFEIRKNEYHQMGILGVDEDLGCVHVPVYWDMK